MGERSVQGKAQGSGQGRDSGAALIQDRGGGAGLGKVLRPVWDLVDMEGSCAHHCTTSASGTWWIWGAQRMGVPPRRGSQEALGPLV